MTKCVSKSLLACIMKYRNSLWVKEDTLLLRSKFQLKIYCILCVCVYRSVKELYLHPYLFYSSISSAKHFAIMIDNTAISMQEKFTSPVYIFFCKTATVIPIWTYKRRTASQQVTLRCNIFLTGCPYQRIGGALEILSSQRNRGFLVVSLFMQAVSLEGMILMRELWKWQEEVWRCPRIQLSKHHSWKWQYQTQVVSSIAVSHDCYGWISLK